MFPICASNWHRKFAEYYPKHPGLGWKKGWKISASKEFIFGGLEGKEQEEGREGVSSTTENTFWLFTHSCLSDAPNASCGKCSVSPGTRAPWGLSSDQHSSPQMPSSPRTTYHLDYLGLSHPVSGHQGLLNTRTFRGFNLSGVKNLLENPLKGSMPRACTCISKPPYKVMDNSP